MGEGEPILLRTPQHRVERRAVAWWRLRALLLALVATGGVGAVYGLVPSARGWLGPLLVVVAVLSIAQLLIMPRWRYAVHRWETSDQAVFVATGWVVRYWRVAPISRIQTVDTKRGPLEQMLGLATVAVTTASARGTVYIVGLDEEVARRTAEELSTITQATPGDAT